MKFRTIWYMLLIATLLWGSIDVVRADDPPESEEKIPRAVATETPLITGDFAPVPIQPAHQVFDPNTANVVRLELDEDEQSLVPAAPLSPPAPATRGSLAPGPLMLGQYGGGKLHVIPESADEAVALSSARRGAGQEVGTAATSVVTSLNFETDFNPPTNSPGWSSTSNSSYFWDDVPCFPFEAGGVGAAWPADLSDRNPCAPNFDPYPPNLNSWLIYGPFSLAGAQAATLDFYFRLVSQSCTPIQNCDYLFWGASVDGTNFYGSNVSGTYNQGIYGNNRYNFASLNLADVFTLGDLTGRSQVWIGFQFRSNGDAVTAEGAFLDSIYLFKNTDRRVYLLDENFDLASFPNSLWESFDYGNVGAQWDDVDCFSRSGEWSMWPADIGPNGRDPCAGQDYINNMYSWLIYGPFDLRGASEAWVDFYFRNQSETGFDFLFWGASTNNSNFYGFTRSGTYISGPYGNGYNFYRFYLTSVPTLGNLTDESQVWLSFVFESDEVFTSKGPFVDDVQVIVERAVSEQVFLPTLANNEIIPLRASLFINNQTGQVINNYTIINPRLNGALIPNIVCSNIPAGATNYNCNATFDPGTYQVSTTNGCNPPVTTGQVTFNVGPNVRTVRCIN